MARKAVVTKKGKRSTPDREERQRIVDLARQMNADAAAADRSPVIATSVWSKNASKDERIETLATVILFGLHKWEIGHIDLPDETMWENGLKCRYHRLVFFGNIAHPDIDQILADINACMGAAALAAIGAGLLTGNVGVATIAFKDSLIACLLAKGIGWANQLQIWIDVVDERGSWHWCM